MRLWNSSRNGKISGVAQCSILPVWGTPRDVPPSRVQRDGERLDPLSRYLRYARVSKAAYGVQMATSSSPYSVLHEVLLTEEYN